jgi:hypothetical protein
MTETRTRTKIANEYAARAETWWSLGEKLWDAKGVLSFLGFVTAAVASAIYNVFGFVNQYGWAGWVLATIPSLVIAGLLLLLFDWVLHVRRMRRTREKLLGGDPAPDAAEPPAAAQPQLNDAQRWNQQRQEFQGHLEGVMETKLAKPKETIQYLERALPPLEVKVEHLKQNTEADINRIAEIVERHERWTKGEIGKIRESLIAIYNREILAMLSAEIMLDAADLYDALQAGETYDENRWSKWKNVCGHWEARVKTWVANARWYAPDVERRVLTIEDAAYASGWTIRDDQFPDNHAKGRSEAVRLFKRHRIIQRQWEKVREEVDRGAVQVAFVGLSPEEVRREPVKIPG